MRLRHHTVELDDGRRIGLSVGGRGVPLLFMPGLLLSRRAYLRMLSRIAGMGFLDHEAWERELLDPDALLIDFIRDDDSMEIGAEEPGHVELELVRSTERPHERMSWARRTYRRWAAKHLRQARSLIRQNTRIQLNRRH